MRPMEGIRVVEVAAWTFVPAAGAVLTEWGAEVLKIEHPDGGDPQRGLISSGLVPGARAASISSSSSPTTARSPSPSTCSTPMVAPCCSSCARRPTCFSPTGCPAPLSRARLDIEDIRAANPDIIYVRGHGQGRRGPDADKGGYDGSAFFARSGVMNTLTYGDDPYGPTQPAAFGDLPGGQTIAGAIAAALFKRERTGETSVVDVSLLAFGMWVNSPDIVQSKVYGHPVPKMTRDALPNPLVNRYLTKDGRLVQLVMLQAVRFWPELVTAVGRPELATDPRFSTPQAMFEHRVEGTRLLDEVFATKTLAEWKQTLSGIKGVWSPVQQGLDLYDDPQVVANGYLGDVTAVGGNTFQLVANPVQFDEVPNQLVRAPELGEHTDDVLRQAGYDEERILALKVDNAIL